MNFRLCLAVLAFALCGFAPAIAADRSVGSWPATEDRTIIENAAATEGFSTLIAALQNTDLAELLQQPGPFTVFAPADNAFRKLPAGRLDALMDPSNRSELTRLLGAHVVRGDMSSPILAAMARASAHGSYRMYTVSGDFLSLKPRGGKLWLRDENGVEGLITKSDLGQSNGVIHVVDTVLVPF